MRDAESRVRLARRVTLSDDDHRRLPEPVRWADMIASQPTRPVPDPLMGRDTETDFMLRNVGFATPL